MPIEFFPLVIFLGFTAVCLMVGQFSVLKN